MRRVLYILLLLLPFAANAQQDSVRTVWDEWFSIDKMLSRSGNEEYKNENYAKADSMYQHALKMNPENFEAAYNRGNTLYKQGNYDEAAKLFNGLTNKTDDKNKLSDTYHNLGNSYLKQYKSKESEMDHKQKKELLNQTIDSYKKALRNNPANENSRYNLSHALRLQQQMPPPQQQEQKDDENKDDSDKKNEKNDQQNKDEEKDQEDKKDPDQSDEQNKKENDELERLLKALENEEKDLQKDQKQKPALGGFNIEKDW